MNSTSYNSTSSTASKVDSGSAETTLRLIARLPAPEGLEDRIIAGLKTVPRRARVLHWPVILQPTGSWMRTAAAAAIVFVVAGGGWGIYTRVQPTQPARVLVMPPRVGAGFSSAGAMRTPQTLNGPVLDHPVTARPDQIKPIKKLPAHIAPVKHSRGQVTSGYKVSAQPAVSAVK